MLACRNAAARAGTTSLLSGVDLALQPGRLAAIVGPNGAGKSTLLGLLAGSRRPDAGCVTLDGRDVRAFHAGELALRRAVLPQESGVAFSFTAQEVVELGRYPHRRRPSAREHEIAGAALAATATAPLAQREFNTLSGGEKARVQLARALAQVWEPLPDAAPRWLLLDEPTAALDLAHQHQALKLLRRWSQGQGVGVVTVLHDLNLALRYADDVLVLAGGRLQRWGPVGEVLTTELVAEAWGVRCEALAGADGVPQYVFA